MLLFGLIILFVFDINSKLFLFIIISIVFNFCNILLFFYCLVSLMVVCWRFLLYFLSFVLNNLKRVNVLVIEFVKLVRICFWNRCFIFWVVCFIIIVFLNVICLFSDIVYWLLCWIVKIVVVWKVDKLIFFFMCEDGDLYKLFLNDFLLYVCIFEWLINVYDLVFFELYVNLFFYLIYEL